MRLRRTACKNPGIFLTVTDLGFQCQKKLMLTRRSRVNINSFFCGGNVGRGPMGTSWIFFRFFEQGLLFFQNFCKERRPSILPPAEPRPSAARTCSLGQTRAARDFWSLVNETSCNWLCSPRRIYFYNFFYYFSLFFQNGCFFSIFFILGVYGVTVNFFEKF